MKTRKTMKNLMIVSLVSLFLISLNATIKAGNDEISIGKKITIESKILDEERTMLVYLPDGYEQSETKYPVMYMLDGKWHFHHATGIVQFLSSRGAMPPTIVVAIVNVDRNRDFTPTAIEKKANTGGADKFMSFITDELMPEVNQNYRTNPYEILVGHSLGGTFATYALLNNPEVFDAYIAISPYMMFDDNMLLAKAKTDLRASYNPDQYFYMTLGDEPKYTESVEKFVKMVKSASPEGLELSYMHMTEEDHTSIPHLSIYYGLEAIYADWKLPKETFKEGLASVDKHYQKLSEKYGYKVATPEYTINAMGYQYLGEKDFDKAIIVFKENVKRFPKSANVYDSLGEAYEKNGQLNEAEKNYAKAVKLGEVEDHAFLKTYKENLSRVETLLAEK
jgi:predicted alpha/beta superfamily hydrolase